MYRKHLLILVLAVTTITNSLAYSAPSEDHTKVTGLTPEAGEQAEAFPQLIAGVEGQVNAIKGNGFSNSTGYWSGYWTWDNVNRVWIWTWVWYWTGSGGSVVS